MPVKQLRARQKENVREEILDAARSLFVRDPYERVSIRSIAQKAGVAPGTIYLYFPDKDHIFFQLCDQTFAKLNARFRAIIQDTADPVGKIRRIGRSYIDFALQNPTMYQLTFMRDDLPDPPDKLAKITAGDNCFRCLCNAVQEAIDRDLLVSSDAMEVAQALWASVHGVSALLISKKGFPFVEHNRLIDRVMDIAIKGILKD